MAISLRLSPEEEEAIRSYANLKNKSVSEVLRMAIMEKIETEFDLSVYNKAIEEYKANPVSYSQEAVERELGL